MPRHLTLSHLKLRWLWVTASLVLVVVLAIGSFWAARAILEQPQPAAASTESTVSPPTSTPSNTPTKTVAPSVPALSPDYVLPPIQDGMVPVITKIPTAQKVVFLTIDDGASKLPENLALLQENKIKASLFLAKLFIADKPDYFKPFLAAGHKIENHSISHPLNLVKMSYQQQKDEICQMADFEEQTYGRRPVFFRPPGGPYSSVTRKAAADCGMKAIIDWEAKANAGRVDYQTGTALRPGEIVLMHFRPEFAKDLQAFIEAKNAAGLEVVLLEDYLKVP